MLGACFEKLYKGSQGSFFEEIDRSLAAGERRFVITANPETLMIGKKSAAFAEALTAKESTVVPDGIGVVKAAERLGYEMHGRVTGVELSEHLLEKAQRKGYSVYLYGAKEEVLSALCERIARDYPGLRLCGAKNGYDWDDDEVFCEISKKAPDIVLVALGIPRQELLISRHLNAFSGGVFVGVGGSFDVLSGVLRRAPALFRRLNLEWLWRIAREPARLRRFFSSNVKFLSEVQKLRREKTGKETTL